MTALIPNRFELVAIVFGNEICEKFFDNRELLLVSRSFVRIVVLIFWCKCHPEFRLHGCSMVRPLLIVVMGVGSILDIGQAIVDGMGMLSSAEIRVA